MTIRNVGFILLALVLLVGLAAIATITLKVEGPHLSLSPLEYDFGTLRQSGTVATTTFDVYNDGNQEVDITDVLASCSCTTGSIDRKVLQPGDHATLTVSFDPNYHYEGEGQFFRTVTVRSNAPSQAPEVKIYVVVDYDLGKDKLKFPSDAD